MKINKSNLFVYSILCIIIFFLLYVGIEHSQLVGCRAAKKQVIQFEDCITDGGCKNATEEQLIAYYKNSNLLLRCSKHKMMDFKL
jgi:hypothetical protein